MGHVTQKILSRALCNRLEIIVVSPLCYTSYLPDCICAIDKPITVEISLGATPGCCSVVMIPPDRIIDIINFTISVRIG
jgi:hypothetical protein